jgi:hypothetical protein
MLVNWGRQRGLRSVYAVPLTLEALLLLLFGIAGSATLAWNTPFAVPLTVLLLSFLMGLQDAVASKTPGGRLRTQCRRTHVAGFAFGKDQAASTRPA